MNALKIGIVEDELLIAESIAITLQQIGYSHTQPVRNYPDAVHMIKTQSPDLLLIDIMIEGDKDGIDLAATVNKEFGIPFIFLTANSDAATINRAKEVNPSAYLVKPFNESDLFSSIEIAFSNYSQNKNLQPSSASPRPKLQNTFFIKEGEVFHKVELKDILYIESDNVYLHIYTTQKHYLVRNKLEDFLSNSGGESFLRVHRSYAVNPQHIENIHPLGLYVGGKEVPLSKAYKENLLKVIHTLK